MDPTLRAALASWHWWLDVTLVVAVVGAIYVTGWCRLRRRRPGAARPVQLVLYLTGLGVIVLTLLSPIDTLAAWLLMMHMLQHELLTMVAPPLLLLANPLPVALWGYPEPRAARSGASSREERVCARYSAH